MTTIHDNGTKVDHLLISVSYVYVANPTAETTTGGGGAKKRNRNIGKSTSKKSKLYNDNDSEFKN